MNLPTNDWKRVHELLDYDPESGVFTWRVSAGTASAGSIAGSINGTGYRQIWVENKSYKAHRLAWLYVHGAWPSRELDHINQIRDDNRIANLREATRSENCLNKPLQSNNSSGFRGVSWYPPSGMWVARIKRNGKQKHLGYFPTAEAASAAYQKAADAIDSGSDSGEAAQCT